MTEGAEAANRAIERFAQAGWARALVSAIPVAGPALDALVTSAASEIANKRFEQFADDLRAIGVRLEAKLDRNAIESAEWQDLAVKAISVAIRTRDAERRRTYAGILLGSATQEWPGDLDNEAVLSALAELSPVEVRLLRHLHDQAIAQGLPAGSVEPASEAFNRAVEALPHELREDITFHLKRIERSGFIGEVTGSFLGYGGGVYVLTPTFVRLVRALEQAGLPSV